MRKAKDLMSHDLTTVGESAALRDAAQLLFERKLSGVPVVNSKNEIAGFISEKDIISAVFPGQAVSGDQEIISLQQLSPYLRHANPGAVESVSDHMSKTLYFVGKETPLAEVVGLILEKNLKRLPVIGKNKHLVGMIDRSALSKWSQKMKGIGKNK